MNAHCLALVAVCAAVLVGTPLSAAVAKTPCFDLASRADLDFDIVVQAPPPSPRRLHRYRHFPATAAASQHIGRLNGDSVDGFQHHWFIWANRCNGRLIGAKASCGHNPKGNIIEPAFKDRDGQRRRTFFTNLKRANACTMAQTAYAIGRDARARREAERAGITLIEDRKSFKQRWAGDRLIDICFLPADRLARKVQAVVLDYEVADRRSTRVTADFLTAFSRLVRSSGREAWLYTNALHAPSQRHTSVNRHNLDQIVRHFDRISMLLAFNNPHRDIKKSAAIQLKWLRAAGARTKQILPVFDLGKTAFSDARFVRDLMEREGFPALMIWRNRANVGGACNSDASKKLACLAFGSCDRR